MQRVFIFPDEVVSFTWFSLLIFMAVNNNPSAQQFGHFSTATRIMCTTQRGTKSGIHYPSVARAASCDRRLLFTFFTVSPPHFASEPSHFGVNKQHGICVNHAVHRTRVNAPPNLRILYLTSYPSAPPPPPPPPPAAPPTAPPRTLLGKTTRKK